MTTKDGTPVSVLGTGAMGRALASALIDAGHPVTVWNRSPGKATALAASGASVASTVADAVSAGPLVIVCLLDHDSVHAVLDPVATHLTGRTVVNVTTTTPSQARELSTWADSQGIDYLDGGIMAVPDMIGTPGSSILYSGSTRAFDAHTAVLGRWGESSYVGVDAGMASLYDLAMLAGMYVMFAGFMHGAAMVGTEGVPAATFAERAVPFLAAMTGELAGFAGIIDRRDYQGEGQQSLEFSDLGDILRASEEQGIGTDVVEPVQSLIRRQVAAGHGKEGFARIYEQIRTAS